ncbi:LPXTG cell wall anchor domain-containing protein [Enterococcus casseliflavus]|nr:LPXTG cell wall anchor domain-containing protein [Enterococcus casseliflavus]
MLQAPSVTQRKKWCTYMNTKAHNPKNNGNSNNHLPKTGQQIKGQLILSSVGALLVTLVFVAIKKRKRSNR